MKKGKSLHWLHSLSQPVGLPNCTAGLHSEAYVKLTDQFSFCTAFPELTIKKNINREKGTGGTL